MGENKEIYYSLDDVLNGIKSFMLYLRKRWWLSLLAVIVGAGLGFGYYRIQKSKYQAVTTFILEDKSAGGSGLSGLASQFGFNIGSLSEGSIFSGDNILSILKSKKVVEKVLLTPIDGRKADNTTLADLYLEFTGIKKSWERKPVLKEISFFGVNSNISPVQDSVLNVIYESIVRKNLVTERASKQGTIIKVQMTASNAQFARLMTERLVQEASRLYLDIRVGTAYENIKQLQRRSDSLLILLNQKSYSAAASQPLDINPGIRTATVPVEIASRDKTVIATLYAEVTKNLEASKLLLSQQTPVIQLLDGPGYLLTDHKKSLFFLLFFSMFASGFVCLLVLFLLFLLTRRKPITEHFHQTDGVSSFSNKIIETKTE